MNLCSGDTAVSFGARQGLGRYPRTLVYSSKHFQCTAFFTYLSGIDAQPVEVLVVEVAVEALELHYFWFGRREF